MIVAAVLCTKLLSGADDVSKGVMIVASIVLMTATFIDINIGLIAIILSMLLSPELEAGSTSGRSVVVRAEDMMLIIVLLTWLARMAIKKDTPLIKSSPLNVPMGVCVAIMCLSTLRGMFDGNVQLIKGTFYVVKLIEYYLLYFIVVNNVTTVKQVKLFLAVTLITAFIVGLWCNTHIGGSGRMTAPFEHRGEPNTLGGYLLFILPIIGGLVLYCKQRRAMYLFLFCFLVPTFIFTMSRASYLGMIPAMITFIALSKRKDMIIYILALFMACAAIVAFGPPALKNRVVGAFRPETNQNIMNVGPIKLGPSPAARIESWREVIQEQIPRKPFFGFGVTGTPFLDGQYMLALSETGIVGLSAFLWLLWRIWVMGIKNLRQLETPMFRGITLGFLAGFVGLLFHAIGTNSFVIIRIAEPFWFFTAIVVKLVDVETGKAAMEDMSRAYR